MEDQILASGGSVDLDHGGGEEPRKRKDTVQKVSKRGTWKKPKDMPKRPMSSYNLFFQLERQRLLSGEEERQFTREEVDEIADAQRMKDMSGQPKRKHRKSHGKIGFADLARTIANTWKQLDSGAKAVFNDRAALEKEAYKRALQLWTQNTKKSPPPESDKATMPQGAHTSYSPIQIPLKPPEPAVGRLSTQGLRDDNHYEDTQQPRMDQNQVPKPMTQTSRVGSIYGSSGVPSIRGGSSSGGSIASVEVAYRPHATATFSAAMDDRPQPSQMFSDERTRLVDAALDAGPSLLTQQIFRRQSTPDYPARNGGQMMSSFNQQIYRRQSTPEFPVRPINAEQRYSVEQTSFVRPETTLQQTEFAQWYQGWPPKMSATAASGIDSNEQGRQQQWGSQYEESFDQEYPYAGRVATVGFGDRVLFQGHPQHPQPAHLPRQSFKSHRHVDSGEELQEVIAAPTEGPESPEEEEEMNRLLMSYEEK